MLERLYDTSVFTALSIIALYIFYKYYHKVNLSRRKLFTMAGMIAILYFIVDSLFDTFLWK